MLARSQQPSPALDSELAALMRGLETEEQASLYNRLGGAAAVDAAVKIFYTKVGRCAWMHGAISVGSGGCEEHPLHQQMRCGGEKGVDSSIPL